jgi:hypothetical protein
LEDCAITKATEEARQSHVWKPKLSYRNFCASTHAVGRQRQQRKDHRCYGKHDRFSIAEHCSCARMHQRQACHP